MATLRVAQLLTSYPRGIRQGILDVNDDNEHADSGMQGSPTRKNFEHASAVSRSELAWQKDGGCCAHMMPNGTLISWYAVVLATEQ